MTQVLTTLLGNGVRVVSRSHPGARCAALGLWLHNGTRHQARDESGFAHLLEHLFFKGAGELNAEQLSARFEAMGGQINAHTGRELTALHGLVPAQCLGELVELLISMLLAPRFSQHDVELERQVVLQELAMVEDDPEEALEDHGTERVWTDHPMGWQILGSANSLASVGAADMQAYLRRLLKGGRVTVVATGAVDHAALVAACRPLAGLPRGGLPTMATPAFAERDEHRKRATSQTQLLWMSPAPAVISDSYVACVLANHILGGGLASRLYLELRERRGLVYGVASRVDWYSDTGLWLIQTSCDPHQAAVCRQAAESTLDELVEQGPSDEELAQARGHVRSSLLIEEDDLEESMERLARETIYLGEAPAVETRLEQIEAAGPEEVRRVLADSWSLRARFMQGPG
jgi:predicted Zn-dependent peptidase